MSTDNRIERPADSGSGPTGIRSPGSAILPPGTWRELGGALGLSPRELEIARGIFDGQKEYAIAARLGCSPDTVHTHTRRLYAKTDVHSHVELLVCIMSACLALPASPAEQPHADGRYRHARQPSARLTARPNRP